jgi:hypothetical protein
VLAGSVEVYYPKDLDMLHTIFAAPCLTTFCRLDELGLKAVGQRVEPDQAVIECRVGGRVLAFFGRPGTSNGPTEAINWRLEYLRGSALGFRNLTNYVGRSLLETGGFRPHLHPQMR